jgi:sulfur relay protein TusB/DsrH
VSLEKVMLHLFFQSIVDDSIFRRAEAGDDIVFFEKAIFCLMKTHALSPQLQEMSQCDVHLYVLEGDLKIRGFTQSELALGIDAINHIDLVKLTEKNKHIFTWN